MTKKATQEKVIERKTTKRKSVTLFDDVRGEAPPVANEGSSAWAENVVDQASSQGFSSDNEAIDFLLKSVIENLGDQAPDKAQLQEFLSLLLDTDPGLREEILAGISHRK